MRNCTENLKTFTITHFSSETILKIIKRNLGMKIFNINVIFRKEELFYYFLCASYGDTEYSSKRLSPGEKCLASCVCLASA